MSVIQGVVGAGNSASTNMPDGLPVAPRVGGQGEMITAPLHGRMYEAARRGKLFYGSNGATPSVTTVALATTYTGLCLYNPANSGKNLLLEQVGYSFLVAFPAAATIGLLAGYAAAGIVTASAAASPGAACNLGGAVGVGRAALSATLVGTPYLYQVFGEGLTGAITTTPQGMHIVDMQGHPIIPPGGYVAIYTSTVSGAASLAASFLWQEEPIG
jgi:hypothetical protein